MSLLVKTGRCPARLCHLSRCFGCRERIRVTVWDLLSPTHFLVSLFVLDFLEGKAQECFLLLCRLCLVKIRATPLSLYHCIGCFLKFSCGWGRVIFIFLFLFFGLVCNFLIVPLHFTVCNIMQLISLFTCFFPIYYTFNRLILHSLKLLKMLPLGHSNIQTALKTGTNKWVPSPSLSFCCERQHRVQKCPQLNVHA